MLLNSYLITKGTNAAHEHIFTSFANTVIPFQIDTQPSQITKPLGTFPGWSLLSLRDFAFTGKRVRSWCYLIVLILGRLPLTSPGIQRIRHCCFGAFFKAVTARQNHSLVLQAVHQCKTRKNHISVPWHLGLSASDGVFPQHLLQECSELPAFVSWYPALHQAGFALHTSCHTCTQIMQKQHEKLIQISTASHQQSHNKHSSSTDQALLNLLAPKSLCPKRLYLFPTPFLP